MNTIYLNACALFMAKTRMPYLHIKHEIALNMCFNDRKMMTCGAKFYYLFT